MPGVSAHSAKKGKGMSKSAARKMMINHRLTDAAVAGELEETHTFGRITKALGFCQMLLKLADGSEALATIRGALKGGGPTRMKVGDVVVVEALSWDEGGAGAGAGAKRERTDPTHLIVGVLEAKQASTLRKAGVLPEWMTRVGEVAEEAAAMAAAGYAWEEDAEREEGEAEAGGKEKEKGKGKKKAAVEDEEIDVSKI
jgi:translation initiation factor IF-1